MAKALASLLTLGAAAACDQVFQGGACILTADASVPSLEAGAGTPLVTSTVTVTSSVGMFSVDGGTVTTSTASSPVTVFVGLNVTASFGTCTVEGVAHATLVTSAGQFTNGLPTAGGMAADGGSSSAGSAGVANSSVTVLLASNSQGPAAPPSNTLYGYTTLQLTTQRSAQVQSIVGDESSCLQVCVGDLQPSLGVPEVSMNVVPNEADAADPPDAAEDDAETGAVSEAGLSDGGVDAEAGPTSPNAMTSPLADAGTLFSVQVWTATCTQTCASAKPAGQ
jgi:hypothetical protein